VYVFGGKENDEETDRGSGSNVASSIMEAIIITFEVVNYI